MKRLLSIILLGAIACANAGPASARSPRNAVAAEDKSAIADLIADYGFAADSRDAKAVALLFTEDARFEVPASRVNVSGRGAIAAAFDQGWQAIANVPLQRRHIITGLRVTGVEGRARQFRAIMNVTQTGPDGPPRLHLTGFYQGIAVPTPDGWRLKFLQINIDSVSSARNGQPH